MLVLNSWLHIPLQIQRTPASFSITSPYPTFLTLSNPLSHSMFFLRLFPTVPDTSALHSSFIYLQLWCPVTDWTTTKRCVYYCLVVRRSLNNHPAWAPLRPTFKTQGGSVIETVEFRHWYTSYVSNTHSYLSPHIKGCQIAQSRTSFPQGGGSTAPQIRKTAKPAVQQRQRLGTCVGDAGKFSPQHVVLIRHVKPSKTQYGVL